MLRASGIPCALCFERAGSFQQSSGASRRENAKVCFPVIASEAKQSMSPHEERKNGLLRFARNDGSINRRNINTIAQPLTTQCSLHQHSMALRLRMA